MFLEELKSISIMNTGLSEKKSKGRPEDGGRDGGWDDGGDEDARALCNTWNTFTRLFLCIFHMRRRIKRAKDERGKGGEGGGLRGANICIDTHDWLVT